MNFIPSVSVIIPTFNHAHFLNEALRSVCNQNYRNWEAIVINNFSDDDTIEVVESFDDPRIRLVNFRNNGIIGASRNHGIDLAHGKYLAFLDSDDVWLPEKLSACMNRIERGYELVCHGLYMFGRNRERNQIYGPVNRSSFRGLLYKGNCIATSATVVKKSIVELVGGFSEDPRVVTVEDYHLWLKLAQNGAKMSFMKTILGNYRFHATNAGSVIKQAKAEKFVVDLFSAKKLLNRRDKIRLRFRYGIIDYGIGRNMQENDKLPTAWNYLYKSLTLHPFYLKTYCAIILNIFKYIRQSKQIG